MFEKMQALRSQVTFFKMNKFVFKFIISALRCLTFSWSKIHFPLKKEQNLFFFWNVTSSHRSYVSNQIEDFFLLKAFLIWLKFLAIRNSNFITKGQDAFNEIFLPKSALSFSYRVLPRFEEKFFPKSALIWQRFYYFFLV